MELFFVLLAEVDVIHFSTLFALFDVAPAVSKMSRYLGLRELFMAVIASLERLVLHLTKNQIYIMLSQNYLTLIYYLCLKSVINQQIDHKSSGIES